MTGKGLSMKSSFCTFFFAILSVFAISHITAADEKHDLDLLAKLWALKPLPKVHYFWPPERELLEDRNNRRLYELARITHSLCVSGEWANEQQIDNCVYTCARVNKTKPAIKASLGINFSPWHRRFGKKLPPTDRGPTYWKEIAYFEQRARLVREWVEDSNKRYHSDVKVGAITLDCERFVVKKGNKAWNEGIREALDAIHIKARAIFPGSRIEWYGRGVEPIRVRGKAGWAKTPGFTGKEIKASLSRALYSVPNLDQMRESYRRTCELADQMGIEDVTPWVALGTGYQPSQLPPRTWHREWDYDPKYSYQIGAELNIKWYGDRPERFAPYNRAKVIIFYPPPFRRRHLTKHFIAYVRGATGVKDVGYEQEG